MTFESQEQIGAPQGSTRETSPSPVAKIEIINIILKALWNRKESATYKDLATPAGVHPTVASQALSASRDLGLTRLAGKKGLYEFTPEGKEYCRMLTGNRESEARAQLRNIILQSPMWAGIVSFLKTNEGIPREPLDLAIDAERRLGKQWSPIMRHNVATSFASILDFAGLVKIDSGKISSLTKQDLEPGPVVLSQARVMDFSARPSNSITMNPPWSGLDFRQTVDKSEPKPEFAELKDESVIIRVRKDLQSIAYAKGFLDFVENGIRHAEKNKKTSEAKSGNEASMSS